MATDQRNQSNREEVSSAEAVLLGALAPGVNGQTWNALKIALVMLGVCLIFMLSLAFTASDSAMVFHVGVLVIITLVLFFLLSSFLAQTGFVTVEHQMQEMGLTTAQDSKERVKEN